MIHRSTRPLLWLLCAALLLRGGLAPGVMPAWEQGRVTVVLCGLSGGTVTLDFGDTASGADHAGAESLCLYAGLGALALPVWVKGWFSAGLGRLNGAVPALRHAWGPAPPVRARGPPAAR